MSAPNGEDRGSPPVGDECSERTEALLLHHARRVGAPDPPNESLQYVFEVYYGRVRRFFTRRGWRPEEAQDLTQSTFIRVYRGRGLFTTVDDFTAWLFRIALNVHFNAQRKDHAGKRNPREESLDQWLEDRGPALPDPAVPAGAGPLEDYLALELRGVAAVAVREMPDKMRRCFLLHLHQDWTYREIADDMGIAEGTVKAHIFQARRRVAERIEAYRAATGLGRSGAGEP